MQNLPRSIMYMENKTFESFDQQNLLTIELENLENKISAESFFLLHLQEFDFFDEIEINS